MAGYVIDAAAICAVLPTDPDPVETPAHPVWTFRFISFTGLIVFWISLVGSGWFALGTSPALVSHGGS
jgi:hypothetical protein